MLLASASAAASEALKISTPTLLKKSNVAKRFCSTELWEEDWFLSMPNEYRLFWFYMLAKCNHAGFFKVNLTSFKGLIDPNFTSTKALEYFNSGKDRVRIIKENLWFIEDFIVYQYGKTLNLNSKVHLSIVTELEKFDLKITSIRGLINLKHGVKDKDKDKDIMEEGTGETKKSKTSHHGKQQFVNAEAQRELILAKGFAGRSQENSNSNGTEDH